MFCPKCGTNIPEGTTVCPSCGEVLPEINLRGSVPGYSPVARKARKKRTGLIVGLLAGCLCLALLAVAGFYFGPELLDRLTPNALLILTEDGKLEILPEINSKEPIVLSSKVGLPDRGWIGAAFSEDRKYVWFFKKVEDCVGTLCRGEVEKILRDPENAEKYIETIATDVYALEGGMEYLSYYAFGENGPVWLLDGGRILYQKLKDREEWDFDFYFFDGEENIRIHKNISGVSVIDQQADQILYTVWDDNYGLSAYSVVLSEPNNRERLLTDLEIPLFPLQNGQLLGVKKKDGELCDLYIAGLGRETERLLESVRYVNSKNGSGYYFLKIEGSIDLADYISGEGKEEAKAIEEHYRLYGISTLYSVNEEGLCEKLVEDILLGGAHGASLLYGGRMHGDGFFYITLEEMEKHQFSDLQEVMEFRYHLYSGSLDAEENLDPTVYLWSSLTKENAGLRVFDEDNKAFIDGLGIIQQIPLILGDELIYSQEVPDESEELGVSVIDLMKVSVKDGVIGANEKVLLEEISLADWIWDEETKKVKGFLYFDDLHSEGNITYGDLNEYDFKSGEISPVLEEIPVQYSIVSTFDDGQMHVLFTGRNSPEVKVFDKEGADVFTAEDCYFVERVSENTYLFISDGDLYAYDGKKKSLVQEDVASFCISKFYEGEELKMPLR